MRAPVLPHLRIHVGMRRLRLRARGATAPRGDKGAAWAETRGQPRIVEEDKDRPHMRSAMYAGSDIPAGLKMLFADVSLKETLKDRAEQCNCFLRCIHIYKSSSQRAATRAPHRRPRRHLSRAGTTSPRRAPLSLIDFN